MSLRVFHIVFIIASVLLSLFVALWGLRRFMDTRDGSGLALGMVFFGLGFALVIYGKRVFRKLKDLP
jgi:dipeptide/tripeptide permease